MSVQSSAYIVPQVLVYQEFIATAAAVEIALFAFIFGENYQLFRYDEADEKILSYLGLYDRGSETAYTWPNRPVNSEIDQSWTRLFFDDACLRYAQMPRAGYTIHAVTGNPNQINTVGVNLTTYTDGTTTWSRDAALFRERDVAVGDGVTIKWDLGAGEVELFTRITALIHDQVAAVISMPTDDADNVAASVAAATATLTTGTAGVITVAVDGSAYDGAEEGDIEEEYTVSVATAGVFGTARLNVISASGDDDPVDEVTPVDGVAVAIGARGLTATFSTGTGVFEANMVWAIDVSQLWTPALLTRAGTYTGANDGTYIVTVTKGGAWADEPQVFVTSNGTLDSSGPYAVEEGVAFILPSGVELTFALAAASTGLSLGDRYYVEVTAVGDGAVRTMEILNSLPTSVFADGSTTAADLSVDFCIVKDIEIPRLRAALLPNWSTTELEFTIYAGIIGTDSTWVDSLGNLLDMPVIGAGAYVQYRALLLALSEAVGSIDDVADVITTLGPVVGDNPLALGVLKALQNSGGTPVKYMATKGAALVDFDYVLNMIYDREDVYGLVPLTHLKTVQDNVKAHCLAASTAERGRWRVCWFAAELEEESAVITEDDDGNMLFCTISDEVGTVSVVDYIRVRCDEANFVDNGVQGSDILRTLYVVDPITNEETYQEYVIDAVLTNEEVRLVAGPSSAIVIPSRMEVWHPNTKDEMATNIAAFAGLFTDRRVRVTFPDEISNGGVSMDGMFASCALSGLRSGVNYHQGLTNVEISGFDDVSRTSTYFGGAQLDAMAANGVWIIIQEVDTGLIFTRHQLTTDMSTLNFREDSLVSNIDAISYYFLRFFRNARYIGRRNITPGLLAQLETDFRGSIEYLKVSTDVPGLGPQLIDGTLDSLEVHATLLDRVVAVITVELPAPFNYFELHIVA